MYVFVISLYIQEIYYIIYIYMFPLCYVVHTRSICNLAVFELVMGEDAMWTSTCGDVATDGDDVAEHFELFAIAAT